MLSKLVELVRGLGGAAELVPCDQAHQHAVVRFDDVRVEFVVFARERAPYPAEIPSLEVTRAALMPHRSVRRDLLLPLLVTRYVSAQLGQQLTAAGWNWIDAAGNCDLRAPRFCVHVRVTERPPPRPGRLPMGPASLDIIRLVLRSLGPREWTTGNLALASGASNVVVTQTMRALEQLNLSSHTARGVWSVDGIALLDRFTSDYPGPQGDERYFYADVDLRWLSVRLTAIASQMKAAPRVPLAVSADVGPDLVAPWRAPTTLIFYSQAGLTLPSEIPLIPVSSLGAANIVQVFPKDRSVFPRARMLTSTANHGAIQLTDPAQMIWDLGRLGGEDREFAAHEVRQWLKQ